MIKKYFKLENYKVKLRSIFGKNYTISYSQNGEDIIMNTLSTFLKITKPTYIDIGAFHPRNLNNTFLFFKKGSHGINIEPNEEMYKLFQKQRHGDTNLNIGIGEKAGTMDYYVMSTPTLNTFSKEEAYEYVEKHGRTIKEVKKIEMWTVSQVIKTYSHNIFPDILSMDTEGLDLAILTSINWSESSPKIICVETMSHSENKNFDILKFLEEKNYVIYADTYINTIFVRKDVWEKRHI